MSQWIETSDGRRWELRRPTELTNMQLARACKEVGLAPDRLGAVLTDPGDDPGAQADRLLAMGVVVYASRLLAGEKHASVEAANDFPSDGWDIVDDEPEEDVDPTGPPAVGGDSDG